MTSEVDEAAKVISKAGKITKGASKVDEAKEVTEKTCKIRTPSLDIDIYPESWTHIYELGGTHGCYPVL